MVYWEGRGGLAAKDRIILTHSLFCSGHNIQGAQQPAFMHIGAEAGTVHTHKGITRPAAEGVGTVIRRCEQTSSFDLSIEGATMRLGIWWLEAAVRGGPRTLPIVNVDPAFC